MLQRVIAVVLALWVVSTAGAQTLKVGDEAPPLAIGEWVKGEPVKEFERGKVYVVEFWATWCGPCIRGMPHVSELQKKHAKDGVTIIGVNIWDDPKNVAPFMDARGDGLMSYTVAIEKKDDPNDLNNGVMARDWMRAAGRNGIPSAFIVGGDGRIAWIGHPNGMDEPLAKAVADAKRMAPSAGTEPAPAKEKPFALVVGDPAPALDVAQWVKGEPVTGFEKGRIYVVEFWATWCGPCVESMPHLTEVQKRFKGQGVRVIGVTSEDRMNTLDAVREMVAQKGDETMGYTVAWDNGRKTSDAFMRQAGINGIPTTFIVDREGRVAWIGHPKDMDEPLERIVSNRWNVEKAAEQYLASRQAEVEARRIGELVKAGDVDGAIALLDSVAQKNVDAAADEAFNAYVGLLRGKDFDTAYRIGRAVVDHGILGRQAMLLNVVAWYIVDPSARPEKQDLDLALKAATRAYELSGGDPAITDTLAAVYYDRGDLKLAIKHQREACEKAKGQPLEEELVGRLRQYEKESSGR